MTNIELVDKLSEYNEKINEALISFLPEAVDGQQEVVRAMRYSIENGGKRLRPVLVLEFCKACGGDVESAMPLRAQLNMCILIRLFMMICPVWTTTI